MGLECERDIATNASRHLPCKFLEPIGRHALNVRATLQRLQLGDPEVHRRTMSVGVRLQRPATRKASPHRTMSMGPSLSLLSREADWPIRVVATGVKAP